MRREPCVHLTRVLAAEVRSLVPIANTLDGSVGGLLMEGAVSDIHHEALARVVVAPPTRARVRLTPSLTRGGRRLVP
jgi:hypothetical protein